MPTKTIPLSRLETNLRATLDECAASGEGVIVQLPGDRMVYIQAVGEGGDDELTSDLLETSADFRALVARSKASPRKSFPAK